MTKRYIDIKETKNTGHTKIDNEEKDVIFYYHWFDRWYDHKDEDLGHFYDVGFEKDGEVFWQSINTGDYIPSFDEYKYLENVNPDDDFKLYINKNKKEYIKIETDKDGYQVIIYKDKYRFNYNPNSKR
ncbi:MAG: hypothetical protein Q4A36_01730 [Candidatus Saccharibacteria bacterium]|nr:hypothetical protein [Candidatus Saccharibacteria bacterium]